MISYTQRSLQVYPNHPLPCFNENFARWHAICGETRMAINIQLRNEADAGTEPAPTFASDAEIKLAEQLRRQLEERYLGSSAAWVTRNRDEIANIQSSCRVA